MTGPTAARGAARSLPAACLALVALALTSCAARTATQDAAARPQPDSPPPVEREFRGVWVAAVSNIDWPSRPGLPVDSQKVELIRILDRARELRLNVVILHVRPAGDALYASELEPWSEYLTGQQGRAPEPFYDPLAFAVEEAHARGLELHAWFNPYRAWHPSARSAPAASHITVANPELVVRYGSYLWMDPGQDAVRRRSVDVVMDVVRRYDVDGVHIDDYFYPYRELGPDGQVLDFPDSVSYARYRAGGGTLERSDWRRSNVDRYVAELYDGVKREKPWVKVGISPIGTWRPNVTPQIRGFDAYEEIYADSRKWLVEGSLDYFVPQIYWPIARTDVSFPLVLDWWVRQNVLGRGMYPGLIPSNVNVDTAGRGGWHPDEIIGQIYVTRGRPGAGGHVHFPMGALMPDGAFRRNAGLDTLPPARAEVIRAQQRRVQARRDTLTRRLRDEAYARPALVPAMTWLDDVPPLAPRVTLARHTDGTRIVIEPPHGEPAFMFVVQSQWSDGWRTELVPAGTREWRVGRAAGGSGTPGAVWVSAVDRVGNQSTPVRATASRPATESVQTTQATEATDRTRPHLPPGVIPHVEWESRPAVGHAADADRRNLRVGDTLTFRDLSVQVLAVAVDSGRTTPTDVVRLRLVHPATTEERSVDEGSAFNWNGYHVAIVGIYAPGELGGGLTALEVATVASLPPHIANATVAGGADMRLRIPHRITNVTLHHTGSAEPLRPGEDPVKKLRDLQAWGASDRNWWDLPYHFLIDLDGNVYEGRDYRYKGDTNTTYEPAGHFLISVIGNYVVQEPTRAQVESIARLMGWALERFGLGPDAIGGHYDYAETTCPGTHLRQLLEDGTLRRLAQTR
jgi:uncharacterized lipoprotein YddW (UPF0748 family)